MGNETQNINATLRTRILLLNKKKDETKFLIMRRVHDGHTQWMVPGGGVDKGELTYEAALRELYEECDIRKLNGSMVLYAGMHKENPRPKALWNDLERAYFRDKAPSVTQIEQTSSWWIVPAYCQLSLGKIYDPTSNIIREKDKFDKAQWVTVAELAQLIQTDTVNFDLNPSRIQAMLSNVYWA